MQMKPALAAFRLKSALRLSRVGRSLAPIPPMVCEKVFFFGGLGAIAYGCWMVYRPAGPIVGGLICFWLATLISGERHAR